LGIIQRSSPQPIAVAQRNIEYVERFTYLGNVIASDGDVEADINTRLAKAAAAVFRRPDNVWRFSTLSLKIKLDLYTSLVVCTASDSTPARLGRVQLEYVSRWTSFTGATYGRFWALHGRTT